MYFLIFKYVDKAEIGYSLFKEAKVIKNCFHFKSSSSTSFVSCSSYLKKNHTSNICYLKYIRFK